MTTESCDRLAQTEGKLDTLLGNYLEELLENTSGIDQKAYPTLACSMRSGRITWRHFIFLLWI